MPLRASPAGASGSFLVVGEDGRRYWCKSLNNFQGPRVAVTEQIVGRLAGLIGAPACELYALCDWLAGTDVQWLYGVMEDNAYYSHDHGFYLTGPDWTSGTLAASRDASYFLSISPQHLDPDELVRLAAALEAMSRKDIESELSKLPSNWPVTDDELAAVAGFADDRRRPVAARLRAMVS
jgi:hypothetical protein